MTERRTFLITGAASGIGAAMCRIVAGPETAILLHTRRNRDTAEAVARQASNAGALTAVALGDLADPDVAPNLVAETINRFGRLDVLISNAGFADRTAFTDLTNDAFTASTEAMAGAFFRLARTAVPHLKAAQNGRVLAISSFVSHAFRIGLPIFPASAAAKAALEALVRALAIELGPHAITVNAIVPGFIRKDDGAHRAIGPANLTSQNANIPLGRVGLPEEVAAVAAFLASQAASYVTGQAIHVNGGLVI